MRGHSNEDNGYTQVFSQTNWPKQLVKATGQSNWPEE